jgi:hypothetical protein
MHYVGVTFILRHRFEIMLHDRGQSGRSGNKFSKVENSAEFDPLYFRGSCQSRSAITGHKLAREKTARQVRSYRLHAPSSTSQNPPRSSVVSPEKPRARFGTRGSAARASHRIAAAALPDQETRADRAPVFFRSVNAGPHLRFFLEGTKIAPSHRNASVMHRTPRDRSVPCRARPLSRVALRRCDRVPACAVPPRARVRVRYDLCPHRVATYRSVQPARRAEVSARASARVCVGVCVFDLRVHVACAARNASCCG